MESQYVIAPQETAYPIPLSGKVPRVKPAKRDEVPKDYRKFERYRPFLSEIILYFVGFTENIRKGIKI